MKRLKRGDLLFMLCVLGVLLAVPASLVLFGALGFRSLFAVTERAYPLPDAAQTACFLEAAGIDGGQVDVAEAETIIVHVAPHQSDSRYALVFSGSGCPYDMPAGEPTGIRLPGDVTLEYVSSFRLSPTVQIFRLTGKDRWLIVAEGLPGSVAEELAALGKPE